MTEIVLGKVRYNIPRLWSIVTHCLSFSRLLCTYVIKSLTANNIYIVSECQISDKKFIRFFYL